MLVTAITSVLLAQIPAALPLPRALEGVNLEFVVQATENYFAAENLSEIGQVVLIGSETEGPLGAMHLAPGQRLLLAFPRGSSQDLLFEIIALDATSWRNSGAFPVEGLYRSSTGTIWIQGSDSRSIGWSQERDRIAHERPLTCLLPAYLIDAHEGLVDYGTQGMAHVPLPIPSVDKREGKPPIVNDEVLPPV